MGENIIVTFTDGVLEDVENVPQGVIVEVHDEDTEVGNVIVKTFGPLGQETRRVLDLEGNEIEEEDELDRFRMTYRCPNEGETWEMTHSCSCNDRCPKCNAEIEPETVEDLEVVQP